jgi:hypothetical protein
MVELVRATSALRPTKLVVSAGSLPLSHPAPALPASEP